jgi:hypothetical protein
VFKTLWSNLGLLKPMAQSVCHLELRCKSYGYISSILLFHRKVHLWKVGAWKTWEKNQKAWKTSWQVIKA